MISLQELNPHQYPTPEPIGSNLGVLLERINRIRTAWGQPMLVTSGLRSQADQQRLIQQGLSRATRSHHLTGEAVDIADHDRSLKTWVLTQVPLLEEVGLWCEALESTPTWVHFQICPPVSGHRFFRP